MKKILFSLFILSFALFTACSSDNDAQDPTTDGEEIAVDITTEVPTLIGQRSTFALSPINSGKGGINNVNSASYALRYILEITANDGTKTRLVQTTTPSNGKVTFSTRLVKGATYKFVAWADFTENSDPEANYHYDADDLEAIELLTASIAIVNDDTKDAYFAASDIAVGALPIKLSLKRPFGKIRYIATDYDKFKSSGSRIDKLTLKYATATDQYTKFNATTGIVDAASKVTTFVNVVNTELPEDGANLANEKTLFWDYLFAPDALTTPNFAPVGFSLTCATLPVASNFISIPVNLGAKVERNKLTTIRQEILVPTAKIELEIIDKFDEYNELESTAFSIKGKFYSTLAAALAAVKAGETIDVAEGVFAGDFTVPANITIAGRGTTTTFTGRITLAANATLKNVRSFYPGTERTAIVVSGNNAILEDVIFDTNATKKNPEAIVTNAGVTGLKVKNCIFNEDTSSKYWKGMYLNTSAGVEVTGCTFNNINPFSTDQYVNTLVVTGNTFNRYSALGDSQMIQLIAIATDGTNPGTWETGLEASVIQIKTANTWNDTTIITTRRYAVKINSTYVNGEIAPWTYK